MESSPPRDTLVWSWDESKRGPARRRRMLWDKNAINQVLAQLGLGNLDALDNATVRAQLDYANQCDLNIFIVAYAILLYHACHGDNPEGPIEPAYFWLAARTMAWLAGSDTKNPLPRKELESKRLLEDIMLLRYLQEVEVPKQKALAKGTPYYGLVCEYAAMALLVEKISTFDGPLEPRHYRIAWIVNHHESEELPLDYAETLDLWVPYGDGFDKVKTEWVNPRPGFEVVAQRP